MDMELVPIYCLGTQKKIKSYITDKISELANSNDNEPKKENTCGRFLH